MAGLFIIAHAPLASALKAAAGHAFPEAMSVVGYNDMPMAGHLTPPLTTVRFQSFDVGRAAGELVIRLLGGDQAENVCLEPLLVLRGTTQAV